MSADLETLRQTVEKEAMEKRLVDRLYLTIIEGDFKCDTFFPEYSKFNNVISKERGEENGFKFRFLELTS